MPMQLAQPGLQLGVVVRNLDAMLRFYGDVLGMERQHSMPVPGIGTLHFMGVGGVSLIKLLEPETAPAPSPEADRPESVSGYRYWTVYVSNLDELYAACLAGGGRSPGGIVEVGRSIRYALVTDPDGNLVEFIEQAAR